MADCQLAAPGLAERLSARCGYLRVPEDRSRPDGPSLELHLAVLEAVRRQAEPDPLFFLAGGPGQAASESFLAVEPAFRQIRQARDLILVDQRGTGRSSRLDCPGAEDDPRSALDEAPEAAERWARACLAELDADPRAYTSSSAVDDLEQLREALGYEQVNVYGISYGTRLAQAWARRHPDRVRSLVLDGVVDPSRPLGLDIARDAQVALDRVFERCRAEPACAERFGDLPTRFAALMARLESQPVELEVDHPVTAEATALRLGGDQAALVFRFASYAPETVSLIPLVIDAAEGRGDYRLLASHYLLYTEQLAGSLSSALHYAVVCAEDLPYLEPEALMQGNAGTYLGDRVSSTLTRVCRSWPAWPAPAELRQPLEADIPTLLLSGEADPVTPPRHAEAVARHLPRSLHLVAPGQGHGVVARGCLPRVVSDFVTAGSIAGLATDCVDEIAPIGFFLDPSGPPP